MSRCPFLSTYESKVNCFKECAFYNYEDTNGVCPFKRIDEEMFLEKKMRYNDLFRNEGFNILDELYHEKKYLSIF
ncbi:hypothetical protein [Clostridium sp.]|jgi:hypothetical protein|uniref:hypothetical protein n=1 Tax=Clostridium sp. TaxID=1506 RepID=UPI0039F5B118